MYKFSIVGNAHKAISKLRKKNRIKYEQLKRKVKQICENPYFGKPLKSTMRGMWRTHIGEHVLIYGIDEINKIVKILRYTHHDKVYQHPSAGKKLILKKT